MHYNIHAIKTHTYQISQNIKCIIKCTQTHHFTLTESLSLSLSLSFSPSCVCTIFTNICCLNDCTHFLLSKENVTDYSQRLSSSNELKLKNQSASAFFQQQIVTVPLTDSFTCSLALYLLLNILPPSMPSPLMSSMKEMILILND